jgi:HAE1 family hydrophobic/amphiphilic exporter-1
VFAGMLGVTFFGLFLTPVFYVTLRALTQRKQPVPSVKGEPAPAE